MENPIDHVLDLGLVNYVQHPENKNYTVFRFADIKRADSFEMNLVEQKIWFEKGEENKKAKVYTLYAIHHADFTKVEQINFTVEAQFKKPLIPFKGLRWSLLLFSFFVMTLAIIGYCKAQNKLIQSTISNDK